MRIAQASRRANQPSIAPTLSPASDHARSGIALVPLHIGRVIVDAVAIERQGRIAKEQRWCCSNFPAVLATRCRVRRSFWGCGIRRRHLAVNDILPFRQHLATRAFDVVGNGHEAQHSRAPLLDRHTLNLRPAAHQIADANIIVEGKLPARPHPARQGHRRQKITQCRMSVGPELRSRNCGLRKT
jgi:hypothetical protein